MLRNNQVGEEVEQEEALELQWDGQEGDMMQGQERAKWWLKMMAAYMGDIASANLAFIEMSSN